jgi:hypothetical protein
MTASVAITRRMSTASGATSPNAVRSRAWKANSPQRTVCRTGQPWASASLSTDRRVPPRGLPLAEQQGGSPAQESGRLAVHRPLVPLPEITWAWRRPRSFSGGWPFP